MRRPYYLPDDERLRIIADWFERHREDESPPQWWSTCFAWLLNRSASRAANPYSTDIYGPS